MVNVARSVNTTNMDRVCDFCGSPALFIAVNSKKARCVERVTQCPGFVEKALVTRKVKYPRKIRVLKPRGPVSEETKAAMRTSAAKRDNTNIGRYHRTDEHRKNLREQMYHKLEQGIVVPKYDSKPEIEFATYLEQAGIGFKKQFIIQFGRIGVDRFRHAYDFHILDTNILVEIDGDYWHSKPGAVERDAECDKVASQRGYHVIRIKTSNLKQSLALLVASIKE